MASVTLTGAYIAPVETPWAQIILVNAAVGVSDDSQLAGEFRPYAGGRVRLVTTETQAKTVKVSLGVTDRDTRELLDSWRGETLVYRDERGRLVFGAVLAISATEIPGSSQLCKVAFTLNQLSYTIEV